MKEIDISTLTHIEVGSGPIPVRVSSWIRKGILTSIGVDSDINKETNQDFQHILQVMDTIRGLVGKSLKNNKDVSDLINFEGLPDGLFNYLHEEDAYKFLSRMSSNQAEVIALDYFLNNVEDSTLLEDVYRVLKPKGKMIITDSLLIQEELDYYINLAIKYGFEESKINVMVNAIPLSYWSVLTVLNNKLNIEKGSVVEVICEK